jgi:hypothetical protein
MPTIQNYPFAPGVKKPRLWARLTNPEKPHLPPFPALALVDTGADDCVFPPQVAHLLGYNLQSGTHKTVITANGPGDAYTHDMQIEILAMLPSGYESTHVLHTEHSIPVDFLLNGQDFLLGTEFLNKFILQVDYPRRRLSLILP